MPCLHETHLPEIYEHFYCTFCYCEMHLPHVNVSRINTASVTSPYTGNITTDEFSAAVGASSPPLHTQCHQSIAQVSDDGNRQRREEEERKGRGGG